MLHKFCNDIDSKISVDTVLEDKANLQAFLFTTWTRMPISKSSIYFPSLFENISFICISFAVETAQPDDDDWEPEKFGENFSKTFIGD